MAARLPPDAGSSSSHARSSTPDRPTAAERDEAIEYLAQFAPPPADGSALAVLRDGRVVNVIEVEERDVEVDDPDPEDFESEGEQPMSEEGEEEEAAAPPPADGFPLAVLRHGTRRRSAPSAWPGDADEEVGPVLPRRVRQRGAARAPPRRRSWPERPIEYDGDGRPRLRGRRDVPAAERRRAMVVHVEQLQGRPWGGTDALQCVISGRRALDIGCCTGSAFRLASRAPLVRVRRLTPGRYILQLGVRVMYRSTG